MKIKLPFALCALSLLIVWQQPVRAQDWQLTGNSGTSPVSNFLGTTDSKALVLRTNNTPRLRITASGNVGIGLNAPEAMLNVAAGDNVSLSSTDNFLLGPINDYNLAFDNNELQARYNGSSSQLRLNSLGGSVWIGNRSGTSPAIYVESGGRVGIGGNLVAKDYILTVNASATLGGIHVLDAMNNIAVSASKSGTGYAAYFAKTNSFSANATVYVTNAGAGEGVYAYSTHGNGIYGATGSSQANGEYAGYFNGAVYASANYFSSDQRLKQNIVDISSAIEIINKLHPKQYQFRQDGNYKLMNLPQGNHYGLIAQEVEKVLPDLVKDSRFKTSLSNPQLTEEEAKNAEIINFKALNYTEMIPILIKGMQEQQSIIENQQQQSDLQQQEIDELKQMVLLLQQNFSNYNPRFRQSAGGNQQVAINQKPETASLSQNIPNPFNNTTTIKYNVPQTSSTKKIIITDKIGKILKEVDLPGSGKGSLKIDASTLSSGAYQYSLYIDGRLADTKQMELLK
jgi:hypothetical protein